VYAIAASAELKGASGVSEATCDSIAADIETLANEIREITLCAAACHGFSVESDWFNTSGQWQE
jgi:hypothetical protein